MQTPGVSIFPISSGITSRKVRNVCASWASILADLPECDLLSELKARLEAELATFGGAFVDAFVHGLRPYRQISNEIPAQS